MKWSPEDTKATLLEKARKLNLKVASRMTKLEIVNALEEYDAKRARAIPVVKSKSPIESPVTQSQPTLYSQVLEFLQSADKPITIQELTLKFGEQVKSELKKLSDEKKVTQYRSRRLIAYRTR